MNHRDRLTKELIEPFMSLNKEGKAGVVIFAGGAALLGAGFIRSGFEISNSMSVYGGGIEMIGFVIASHGNRRQKNEEL